MVELPRYAQIEPVGQCNLRCTMCSIQYRRDGPPYGPLAFMPYDAFTALLSELPTLEELHLQGLGEPLMHPRFFDMIAFAVARGVRVSVNSNLILLNADRAERCVTSGLATLHISIDGATAETYERIRVRSKFARLMRNIELLSAAKERFGARHPALSFTVVVMRQNLEELADLVRLAGECGIAEVNVQHLCHDFGESTLPARYDAMRTFVREQALTGDEPSRIENAFTAARAEASARGIRLRLPELQPRPFPAAASGRSRCDFPWRGTYVSFDGAAMPCCMVATPDRAHVGNVAEQGFAAMWNGPVLQDFRARLDSAEPPEICRSCAVYQGVF
ncbi:MAG: radical SAM protein [Candidatus Velthaea sp.]